MEEVVGRSLAERKFVLMLLGSFALSAATALIRNTKLPARAVVEQSMQIAAKICIYTNDNFTFEELG